MWWYTTRSAKYETVCILEQSNFQNYVFTLTVSYSGIKVKANDAVLISILLFDLSWTMHCYRKYLKVLEIYGIPGTSSWTFFINGNVTYVWKRGVKCCCHIESRLFVYWIYAFGLNENLLLFKAYFIVTMALLHLLTGTNKPLGLAISLDSIN